MVRLEAAQLTAPEHIAEIANGLGELLAQHYYPVRFDYAFSSCEYPVVISQAMRDQPHYNSSPVVLTGVEVPDMPLFNVLIEKKSRSHNVLPFIVRQVSFYKDNADLVTAYEADLQKWAGPNSVDMSYQVRQELYSRKALGDLVTDISPISVSTVRMIDRLLVRRSAADGTVLTRDVLQSHQYYKRFIR